MHKTGLFLLGLLFLMACSSARSHRYRMETFALRLSPGQDLRLELEKFARDQQLQAGFVITCVGSLRKAVIRPADQSNALIREAKFEIVSLVGTLSPDGPHLHIALSDSTGATIGGHLLEGCEVYTTAELVLGNAPGYHFSRVTDPATGFKELRVENRAGTVNRE